MKVPSSLLALHALHSLRLTSQQLRSRETSFTLGLLARPSRSALQKYIFIIQNMKNEIILKVRRK